jgi:hypothetical protein
MRLPLVFKTNENKKNPAKSLKTYPKRLPKPKSLYCIQKSIKVHLMALMDMKAYI